MTPPANTDANTDADQLAALGHRLGCRPEEVAERLLSLHGILMLSDADGPGVLATAVPVPGEPAGWRLQVGPQTVLLYADPWCPTAAQALLRHAHLQARLGLATPGQVRRLQQVPAAVAAGAAAPNSVVDFVHAAIAKAYADSASDIHFETDRTGISVKYRLDGAMVRGDRLADAQRAEEVISRIKVMAQLDITERRRPQDGRIRWQVPPGGADALDLRVSIMPSLFGEDAVLRLLDKAQLRHGESKLISLDTLGFAPLLVRRIRELARRPHGMLLITGPTGSGKTTTVYAALTEVNDGLEKIVTIEDPVEYELPGVLQIPVNEQKGLSFASGLRSILRHDPDQILVGEIRDAETAQIAVQSSLTGHLVFTTVHANSLFDVLGRFRHFGIEAFALASALNGVVVQRLLRRVCPHGLGWREPKDEERERLRALGLPLPLRLPVPAGCPTCRHTGYKGRFVVAEVHELDDVVRDLMVAGASMTAFKQAVYAEAGQRLLPQALRLVEEGHTTLEEVSRVVGLA